MMPPEVYQEHGNFDDWKTLVGTGAYMIGNYIQDSVWTYTRNPDYWRRDPKFPQNKLPYTDEFKILIIPDRSSQQAALRSGRIDLIRGLTQQQAETLQKTNPELVYFNYPWHQLTITPDLQQKPFNDIRVRKAMQMAIDMEAINDALYN